MAVSSLSAVEASTNEESCDEFSWEAYFAHTGAMAVDACAFRHVERSQQRLTTSNVSALSQSSSEPDQRVQIVGDSIQIGRCVDVQDERDPRKVWPAEILENVGGRLLLKYLCLQDAGPPFWAFYLSEQLHPAGVCETDIGRELELHYALPSTCGSPGFIPSVELLRELAETTKANTLDSALFQERPFPKPHQMEVGMWLEAVDPLGASIFYPAVVVAVLNKYYFVISHDASMTSEMNTLNSANDALLRTCHAGSSGLFPIGFAGRQGLSFAAPEGFDWAAYLRTNVGKMAHEKCFQTRESDDRFIPGRRLEAVNPSAPHQICAATVIRRMESLVWLHIDSSSHLTQTHVIDCRSTRLFPCGWCAVYGYPLKAPYEHSLKDFKTAQATMESNVQRYSSERDFLWLSSNAQESAFMPEFWLPDSGCPWSPTIYVSARCFTGPHIDRLRLSTKPRQVGPGPMVSVLKTVAGNVVSAAYRPREVLAELQPVSSSESPMMQIAEIKAKYRTKRWRGSVHVCAEPQQIPEWCRQLCIRLEACPGLLGFKPYLNDKCPFDCSRTPKVRRLGIAKPLSCVAAKRLKTRLAVQQKRLEAAEDSGQQQQYERTGAAPKIKRLTRQTARSNSSPSIKDADAVVNRPVTRATKLRKFLSASSCSVETETNSNSSRRLRLNAITESSSENECAMNGAECYVESNSESSIASGLNEANGSLPSSHAFCCCDGLDSPSAYAQHENGRKNSHSGLCHLLSRCNENSMDTGISLTIPPVESDPLKWTPDQLHSWLRNTVVNVGVADQLLDELIDGQSFMLMDIRDVQDYLDLKLGPALKVCGVIKELKTVYLRKYAASAHETKDSEMKCPLERFNGGHGDLVHDSGVLDE